MTWYPSHLDAVGHPATGASCAAQAPGATTKRTSVAPMPEQPRSGLGLDLRLVFLPQERTVT